jgi:hypothetical protein
VPRRNGKIVARPLSDREIAEWFATISLHRAAAREEPLVVRPKAEHSVLSVHVRGVGWIDVKPRRPSP